MPVLLGDATRSTRLVQLKVHLLLRLSLARGAVDKHEGHHHPTSVDPKAIAKEAANGGRRHRGASRCQSSAVSMWVSTATVEVAKDGEAIDLLSALLAVSLHIVVPWRVPHDAIDGTKFTLTYS